MKTNLLERATFAIERVLAIVLIAVLALNALNVAGRYLLGREIPGADEVQVFALVWITFLGAVGVGWRGEHLRMDVIAQRLPAGARTALRWTESILVVVVTVFVAYHSIRYVMQIAAIDRRSDIAGIPMVIPHAAVATSLVLLAALAVLRLLRPTPSAEVREGDRP